MNYAHFKNCCNNTFHMVCTKSANDLHTDDFHNDSYADDNDDSSKVVAD